MIGGIAKPQCAAVSVHGTVPEDLVHVPRFRAGVMPRFQFLEGGRPDGRLHIGRNHAEATPSKPKNPVGLALCRALLPARLHAVLDELVHRCSHRLFSVPGMVLAARALVSSRGIRNPGNVYRIVDAHVALLAGSLAGSA